MPTQLHPPPTEGKRFYFASLDGLRFVAFLMVMMNHAPRAESYFPEGSWVGHTLTKLHDFGWIGVDIFLVLSSFLLVTLLTKEKQRSGTVSLKLFYTRRALRIWPLYYFYIVLSVVLLPLVIPASEPYGDTIRKHLFPLLTFTGNFSYAYFHSQTYNFAAHMWTISLEEQFYLVIPILVLVISSTREAAILLSVLLLTAISFRAYIQLNEIKYPMIWVLPICRMDPFVVGGVCSWIYFRRAQWLTSDLGNALLILGLSGFALVMCFDNLGTPSLHNIWQLTITAASSGCLLLSALCLSITRSILSVRPIVFLGRISFGLYVFHFVASEFVIRFVPPQQLFGLTPMTWLLLIGIILVAATVTATLSYYCLERPFGLLKEKFEVVASRPS